jgi:hypothetical protein
MNDKRELIASGEIKPATDYNLVKMENETIMAAAVAKPRNHKAVMQELIDQIEAYPSFAESVMYAKPVGDGKFVRGLSIRAAEALAAAWGFNRIEQVVEPIDEDTVRVTATFTDFQSGRIWRDSGIVSKFYKRRGGGIVRYDEDRFYNTVVKAELSKRVREAIMRSVPPGVRSELQAMAERTVAKLLTNDVVNKIVASFAALGVDLAKLETLVGKTIDKGWTLDDRALLQQVYTGLKDGETTVAEVFAQKQEQAKVGPASEPKTLAEAVSEASGG